MASRKEYEMLFQLNAQLGGSYNSTFSKANQQLAAMQKEIQTLSKSQADITAFQKQQTAVDATRKKLEVLQQQYDNIQKEMRETEGYSSALENKLLSKQQQIDKTSASLEQQTQKLTQMDAALREAGYDTGNLGQESAKLGSQIDELKAKQEQAADEAGDFGDVSVEAFGAIQQAIIAAGIATALHEIYEAYMECVNVAGEFEASMSNVEALSGATAEEMAALTAEAKELGATTKFTAQESSAAMGYMAMAGWDVYDMLAGMDGVLQLAAASGEDLAMVSDIVTDSLSAFGLTAADTAHFSDVLAAAATNSNTNVSIMGETFKMSASIAGALGYSIEDVAVAVGLMANSGVKGSIAGTALRNTFNGLLTGVTLTGNAFGEYEYSAVKADGTMKDFSSTLDELRVYFEQMTEAERVSNAMTIAGQRGYNGLLAILNATEDDYTSLTASINNCTGAAERMASVKLDNMQGELVLMQSAMEALDTSVGEAFTPTMRELYAVGADVFRGLDAFVRENPELLRAGMAFVSVIGAATAALTAYSMVASAVKRLELASLFAKAGPILLMVAGVAGLVAMMIALTDEIDNTSYVAKEQEAELERLNAEYQVACERYGETSDEAGRLRYQINALNEEYQGTVSTVDDLLDSHDSLLESLSESAGAHQESSDGIHTEMLDALALAAQLRDLADASDLSAGETELMAGIVQDLNSRYEGLNLSLRDVQSGTDGWSTSLDAYIRKAADAAQKTDAMNRSIQLASEQAQLQSDLDAYTREVEAAEAEVARLQALHDANNYWGIGPYSEELALAQQRLSVYRGDMDEANASLEKNREEYASLLDVLGGNGDAMDDTAIQAMALRESIETTTAAMAALAEAYEAAYDAAYESVSGQYALWDNAESVVATSAGSINAALESQIAYWDSYNTNLESLQGRANDIEGLGDVIASFADGSNESVSAVAGMATATDAELAAMVENWKALQAEQETTAGSIADLKTDFTDTMDELQQALAEDIEAMDLSEDAAESGRATIQGFIDGADAKLPDVEAAYARVAARAMEAIDSTLGIHSPSRVMIEKADMTWAGYIQGTQDMEPEVAAAMADTADAGAESISAEELQSAMLAPQLLSAFSGISATPAEPMGRGGGVVLSLSPVYNITGVGSSSELEAILRRHDDDLRAQVLEWMDDAGVDSARRAYT